MNDERLADLLALLGLINKHDVGYSVKPHGKMCFMANEVILLPTVVDAVQEECLLKGFPLRISHRGGIYHTDDDGNDTQVAPGKYIVIVEKSWKTIENEDLNRAIVEACAITLEGAQ